MSAGDIIFFALAVLVMLVGLLGIIIPFLPGVPLIFSAVFLYAALDGFESIGWGWLGFFAGLTVLAIVLDWLPSAIGVRRMGGSSLGMAGAVVGMLIGLVTGGLVGLLAGSFIGAVAGELAAGKDRPSAVRAGLGSFLGFFFGSVIKLAIGVAMAGIFVWRVLF